MYVKACITNEPYVLHIATEKNVKKEDNIQSFSQRTTEKTTKIERNEKIECKNYQMNTYR